MWKMAMGPQKDHSERESHKYAMLKNDRSINKIGNIPQCPGPFKILSLHIDRYNVHFGQGSTQDLWKTCLLKKKKKRENYITNYIPLKKPLRVKCK